MKKRFSLSNEEIDRLNKYYVLASVKQQAVIKRMLRNNYISPQGVAFILSVLKQIKKQLEAQHTYTDMALYKYNSSIYRKPLLDNGQEYNTGSKKKHSKTTYIDSNGSKRYI